MAVTKDAPGPYAPAKAVLSLIERHRQKGLPVPIDSEVLARAGISESLIPRTLQALQSLDLVNGEMRPTETFEGLRLAPEAEYQSRLSDWLRDAYADALTFVDPATASENDIHDAFRSYRPSGQRDRMVSLFTGLFQAAGVMPERRRQRASSPAKNGSPSRSAVKPPSQPADKVENETRDRPRDHVNPHSKNVINQLLDKFPAFDPSWNEDVQAKWFEGYQRLLTLTEK